MSEFPNSFDDSSVEKKSDEKEKKDGSSKSTRSSSVPRIPLFERPSDKPVEASNMMDKLGELFVKRDKPDTSSADKPLESDKPKLPEQPVASPAEQNEPAPPGHRLPETNVEATAIMQEPSEESPNTAEEKDEESDNESANDLFKNTEPAANDIGAGEFVLHLNGDTPLGERVIPLHNETLSKDTSSDVAPETPVEWHSQPEQQHQATVTESPTETVQTDPGEAPQETTEPTEPRLSPYESKGHGDKPETGVTENNDQAATEERHTPSQEEANPIVPEVTPTIISESPDLQTPQPHIPVPEYGSLPSLHDGFQERMYNQQYQSEHVAYATSNDSNTGETSATKQEVEDALYYATKDGQRRGVIAGALFFGGYEHFKHRRREKRQEKIIKNQSKQIANQQKDQHWQTAEHTRQLAQAERITWEQQSQSVQAVAEAVRPVRSEMPQTATSERRFAALNQMDERRSDAPTERRFGLNGSQAEVGRSERKFARRLERLLPKHTEKAAAETVEASERLEIPAEHRLETSAWHTIEVDAKTGKAVENPAFAYGHEYYRERAHEAVPRDHSRNAAAGEVALVAAAMDTAASNQQQNSSNSAAEKQANQANQTTDTKQSKQSAHTNGQSNGPLWPWIIAFVVVVVLLVSALR